MTMGLFFVFSVTFDQPPTATRYGFYEADKAHITAVTTWLRTHPGHDTPYQIGGLFYIIFIRASTTTTVINGFIWFQL